MGLYKAASGTDGFGCVYHSWSGDGDLITRVATVTLPSGAAYASGGIMFRDGLTANAMHASIVIGTDGKLKFRRRKTVGGTTLSDGPSAGTTSIPRWLKLSRRGSTFAAFYSQDGATWQSISVADSTVGLPSTVSVGVFALRNGGTPTTRATFSNVSVTGAWTNGDVGAVGSPGSMTSSDGTFTVRGGGSDLWGTWTEVLPATTIARPATVHVGMVALRNGGSSLATAAFTNVSLTR